MRAWLRGMGKGERGEGERKGKSQAVKGGVAVGRAVGGKGGEVSQSWVVTLHVKFGGRGGGGAG